MLKFIKLIFKELNEFIAKDINYFSTDNSSSDLNSKFVSMEVGKSVEPSLDMPEAQLKVAVKLEEFKIYERSRETPREKYESQALKVAFDDIREYQNINQIKRIHAILDYIGSGKKVLDCAGGSGYISNLIKNAGNDVTVMDRSKINLNRAKWIRKLNTIYGNLDRLPFPDSSFDIVFVGEALEYVDSLGKPILEIDRVCKKEGNIIVTINSKKNDDNKLKSVQYTSIADDSKENGILILSFRK